MVLTPQQFDSLADAFQAFYDALPTSDVSDVNAFLSRLALPGYQLSSGEILNCRMALEFYIRSRRIRKGRSCRSFPLSRASEVCLHKSDRQLLRLRHAVTSVSLVDYDDIISLLCHLVNIFVDFDAKKCYRMSRRRCELE